MHPVGVMIDKLFGHVQQIFSVCYSQKAFRHRFLAFRPVALDELCKPSQSSRASNIIGNKISGTLGQ